MKEGLLSVAEQVENDFERSLWPEDRIRSEFGLRSLQQIEDSREIHFLCCLERNFAFAYRAALAGVPTKLVMSRIARPFQGVKLGTSVEIVTPEDEPLTFVAANSGNKFMEARNPTRPSHTHTHKVDFDESRTDVSWFEHFGVESPEQLDELIPGFRFDAFLKKVIQNNTEKRLLRARTHVEANRSRRPAA